MSSSEAFGKQNRYSLTSLGDTDRFEFGDDDLDLLVGTSRVFFLSSSDMEEGRSGPYRRWIQRYPGRIATNVTYSVKVRDVVEWSCRHWPYPDQKNNDNAIKLGPLSSDSTPACDKLNNVTRPL